MKHLFTVRVVARLAAVVLVAGCASSPQTPVKTAATTEPIYDREDPPTGTNIRRRPGQVSAVVEVDKDAIQGAARTATRNSGN